jgi:C4-dicarboxylate-specific signal transduction histidine kinase
MRDAAGHTLRVIGLVSDVTEARRSAAALAASETRLRLAVEDVGPGFPPESPSSAGNIQSTKRQGTGLGLVTVASLVAAARGELSRTNRAGGGARVEVVLPRAESSPVTDEAR